MRLSPRPYSSFRPSSDRRRVTSSAYSRSPAHRDAVGETGHLDLKGFKQLGNIHGGGFPLDSGVGGHDDLLHLLVRHPHEELLDPDLIRADAVHGGDGPVEHMIHPMIFPGAFKGHHVPRILHHADNRPIPIPRPADGAELLVGQIAADGAFVDLLPALADGGEKILRPLIRQVQQIKRESLGRFVADARQPLQLFDHPLKRRHAVSHRRSS